MSKLTRNLLIVGLALAVWGISFLFTGELSPTEDSTEEICYAQLNEIQRAKLNWAKDYKQGPDAVPPADQLLEYFPKHQMPHCPGMGKYFINAVSNAPRCSIKTHVYQIKK
ncbi:MAG: Type secretion system protein [Verrucomicrobiales bacterium]|nr:Type secretion system protein [Verrucomicrobiales bacterium]